MTEFLSTILIYLLTWQFLLVMAVSAIFFEHNDIRWIPVCTALTALVVSFFYFNLSILDFVKYFIVYLIVGFIWSFYRYKRFVDEKLKDFHECYNKEAILREIHPKQMINTCTAWVIIWPFSAIENIVGDLINLTQRLVKQIFNAIYYKIYNNAINTITKETKDVN